LNAAELLASLRERGLLVTTDGVSLTVRPKGGVAAGEAELVTRHKAELIRLLRATRPESVTSVTSVPALENKGDFVTAGNLVTFADVTGAGAGAGANVTSSASVTKNHEKTAAKTGVTDVTLSGRVGDAAAALVAPAVAALEAAGPEARRRLGPLAGEIDVAYLAGDLGRLRAAVEAFLKKAAELVPEPTPRRGDAWEPASQAREAEADGRPGVPGWTFRNGRWHRPGCENLTTPFDEDDPCRS
jgi:hypothetical protein